MTTIAYLVRDPLPPKRPDLLTLFGVELPRRGIHALLIGQQAKAEEVCSWPGGPLFAAGSLGGKLAGVLTPLRDMAALWKVLRGQRVDCIQVRDKIASGLAALLVARLLGLPFVYWMSFPMVEGHAVRARDVGLRHGVLVAVANRLRAWLSRVTFYGLVLKQADHVFVQSEAMQSWLAGKGLPLARMTPVPMGVDDRLFQRATVAPAVDARFARRRVIVYVGVLGRARNSTFLLDVVAALRLREPAILLVLAGDAVSADERAWIRAELAQRQLESHVLITGWLEQAEAMRYTVAAEVALSPVPRGELFDVSSPTKLIEYMALGVASVANDIPDQQQVIARSGAGLCVPMETAAFCDAVLRLLDDPALRQRCAEAGPPFVARERTYDVLARTVARTYDELLGRPLGAAGDVQIDE